MKISHEIPKQLFPQHDLINDYPYALAHLMSPMYAMDEEYTAFYDKQLRRSKFSILDNSAYELGGSIDLSELYRLGEKYKPSHIVLPDVYGDYKGSMELLKTYDKRYGAISTPRFIAVVQGQDFREYKECFIEYLNNPVIDIIALTFRVLQDGTTRTSFLKSMFHIFPQKSLTKKIHLLGCGNVKEFIEMDSDFKDKIYSVDTSAPIVHGWNGNEWSESGFKGEKPKDKLAECLDIPLDSNQLDIIYTNVKHFRGYVK